MVFLGPPSVGKSHLAIALGIEAVNASPTVYFTRADTLVEKLKKASREDLLDGKLKTLTKYKLLIIDEMGYMPFDNEDAFCFFQLVSRRYEKNSTVFTSNKSYGEWGASSMTMLLLQLFWTGFCIIILLLTLNGKVTGLKNGRCMD